MMELINKNLITSIQQLLTFVKKSNTSANNTVVHELS